MTTTAARPPAVKSPQVPELGTGNAKWAFGFSIAAIVLFVFYQYILPNLSQPVRNVFREWLPMSAVNEALVWVICAVGLNIVIGYAGLLDLGFVAFWAIGSYMGGWLMSEFFAQWSVNIFGAAAPGAPGISINFWVVLVLAALVCAVCGMIIGAPTLRLKSDYLALVTLGFGEIIPQVFKNGSDINGFNLTNGTIGISPLDPINVPAFIPGVPSKLGVFDTNFKFLIFVFIAGLCVFVSIRIREGRLGRAWLAIREDELAASMMGIPLMRTKLAAYAVGAAMGGVGGVVFAMHVNGVVSDTFRFSISITLVAMVVLGGMGNVWGVIVGALLLAWINSTGLAQVGNTVNSSFGTTIDFASFNFLLFGGILVFMMLFRRGGFFPETRNQAVMGETEVLEAGGAHLVEADEDVR